MNIQHLTCIKLYVKNIIVHANINNKIFLTIRTFLTDLLHHSLLTPVTETLSTGDGGDGVVLG